MSRKNVLIGYNILNTAGVAGRSMAASFDTFSTPTNINYQDNGGLLLSWPATGSPVGIVEIYVSNDSGTVDGSAQHPVVNWSRLAFSDESGTVVTNVAITAGGGTHNLSFNQIPFSWIALKYIRTSGTGTLTGKLTLKQVGG